MKDFLVLLRLEIPSLFVYIAACLVVVEEFFSALSFVGVCPCCFFHLNGFSKCYSTNIFPGHN